MLFSVEQAFVGRDEKRASLKMPAWKARSSLTRNRKTKALNMSSFWFKKWSRRFNKFK